jgi:formylglycine-generating enzyme required for sulfatase activity
MLKQGYIIAFLLLVLAFFPLAQAEQQTKKKESKDEETYVHKKDQCLRCHVDNEELQSILTISRGKCDSCHEAGTHGGMYLKGGAGGAKKKQQTKRISPTLGMQYSLFSKTSRLGDAPNEMILIPAGEFIMGTDIRLSDEGPQHKVTLPAFYIDKYEVTNLQYKKFNDETHRRSPRHFRNRTFPEGKADHPVTYVSWEDAKAYCEWAGKRLPTDEEWEKAARGTDGRMFPWGDEFDIAKANTPLRWQQAGQFGDTTPVGAFEAGKSPYGLYDVSGNVWEWTASWYKAYPGNDKPSESYGERYKTLKGGSWFDCSFYACGISAPVFNRAFFAKRVKNDSFGFRCAKDAE